MSNRKLRTFYKKHSGFTAVISLTLLVGAMLLVVNALQGRQEFRGRAAAVTAQSACSATNKVELNFAFTNPDSAKDAEVFVTDQQTNTHYSSDLIADPNQTITGKLTLNQSSVNNGNLLIEYILFDPNGPSDIPSTGPSPALDGQVTVSYDAITCTAVDTTPTSTASASTTPDLSPTLATTGTITPPIGGGSDTPTPTGPVPTFFCLGPCPSPTVTPLPSTSPTPTVIPLATATAVPVPSEIPSSALSGPTPTVILIGGSTATPTPCVGVRSKTRATFSPRASEGLLLNLIDLMKFFLGGIFNLAGGQQTPPPVINPTQAPLPTNGPIPTNPIPTSDPCAGQYPQPTAIYATPTPIIIGGSTATPVPCVATQIKTTTDERHHGKGKKLAGLMFEMLKFIFELLQFIFQLFGMQLPPGVVPPPSGEPSGAPVPSGGGEQPSVVPTSGEPMPSDNPGIPVPPCETTPPPATNGTSANITLILNGIGTTGNQSPLHTQRTATLSIYNAQNQLVTNVSGTVTYTPSTGDFRGAIDLGTAVQTGFYTVKIKTDQYLQALVPGIQSITSGQTATFAPISLKAGDINGDNIINIADYNVLMGCYSDLQPALNCQANDAQLADLTDDGHVNQLDYNLFLSEIGNISGGFSALKNVSIKGQ